jgi:hypothetical protein
MNVNLDIVNEGTSNRKFSVSVSASVSDSDGILNFEWHFGSGIVFGRKQTIVIITVGF